MDITTPWASGGSPPPDVITFLGRIDGTAITVGPHPGSSSRPPAVVLRARSPLLDVPSVVYLAPEEAHRLAALLTSAALASAGPAAPGSPPAVTPPSLAPAVASLPRPAAAGGPIDDLPAAAIDDATRVRSRHVITAGEGSSAAELHHALALLPVGARLVDFVSDTDVALIFTVDEPPASAPGLDVGWPT